MGWLMLGVPADMWEPHPSPPPMPRMRDPSKGKGAAPPAPPAQPAMPAEVPQGESDVAFTCWLQQEKQRAEAVQRGEDPESLQTAQKLAAAEEERLGVDAATLVIMEDELPIAERMKKKRRMTTVCPNYAEKEEEG